MSLVELLTNMEKEIYSNTGIKPTKIFMHPHMVTVLHNELISNMLKYELTLTSFDKFRGMEIIMCDEFKRTLPITYIGMF